MNIIFPYRIISNFNHFFMKNRVLIQEIAFSCGIFEIYYNCVLVGKIYEIRKIFHSIYRNIYLYIYVYCRASSEMNRIFNGNYIFV